MNNSTENTTFCEPPTAAFRIIAGALLTVLCVTGTLAYTLIIAILLNYHAKFKHPFYVLQYHLAGCDCLLLLSVYLLVIPQTAAQSLRYAPIVEMLCTTLDTVSFNAIMICTYLITINRVMCFFWSRGLEIFFNRVTVHIVSLLPWAFGITIALITDLSNCPKVFDECSFVYMYVCKSPTVPVQVSVLLSILQIFGYCGPILMTIGYVAIFVHLRKLHRGSHLTDKQKKNFTREINLLKQGTVIAALLLIECLAFWLLPGFFPGSRIISLIISSLSILNSAINPFIYLNFNSLMRQCARALCSHRFSPLSIFMAPTVLSQPSGIVSVTQKTGAPPSGSKIRPMNAAPTTTRQIIEIDADIHDSKA